LAKNGSDRLTNEGHSLEETSLADENVEQNLVDANELKVRLVICCR
jgi:hypothetical protein